MPPWLLLAALRGSEPARSRGLPPHEAAPTPPEDDDRGLALRGVAAAWRPASGERPADGGEDEALARRLLGSLRDSRPRSHVARHSC